MVCGQESSANTAESGVNRKPHIASADLAVKAVESSGGEIIRNGKRKSENTDLGITNGLSAAKRLHYSSASVSPATPHQSLLAARRADVKSTSELVAQLTENLPGYLAINISQNQDPTKNECTDNEGQTNDVSQTSRTSFALQTEASKKKEKRSRSKKDKEKEGRIRDQSVAEEKVIAVGIGNSESVLACNTSNSNPSTSKMVVPMRNGKYDWYAMLPSLETLRNREHFRSKPSSNQRKSYIVNVLGREVLALPYIDVGLPDFLEYQYPKAERFYAEENFMYGAPRPN
uniref:Doublecortin domain-containing protein n=1 Tax=Elaeophora elaphi TaxID=1147741 RepID=A0A0R3S6S3_9BILA